MRLVVYGPGGRIGLIHGVLIFVSALLLYTLVRDLSYSLRWSQHSWFFDPSVGMSHEVSSEIVKRSADWLSHPTYPSSESTFISSASPYVCVAFMSARRSLRQYLNETVASFHKSMSPASRARFHVLSLIVDVPDPSENLFYNAPWMLERGRYIPGRALVDQQLHYAVNGSSATPGVLSGNLDGRPSGALLPSYYHDSLVPLADQKEWTLKEIFDYSTALDACASTGLPHALLIEDDVVFRSGWDQNLFEALDHINSVPTGGYIAPNFDWVYYRLFFTDAFMGFESTDTPFLLLGGLLYAAACTALVSLVFVRRTGIQSGVPVTALLYLALMLAVGVLGIAVGKTWWRPIAVGFGESPRGACCSQALLIPQRHLVPLAEHMRAGTDPVDSAIDMYADSHALKRFAHRPPFVQHVGAFSSKGAEYISNHVWSFDFEHYWDF